MVGVECAGYACGRQATGEHRRCHPQRNSDLIVSTATSLVKGSQYTLCRGAAWASFDIGCIEPEAPSTSERIHTASCSDFCSDVNSKQDIDEGVSHSAGVCSQGSVGDVATTRSSDDIASEEKVMW